MLGLTRSHWLSLLSALLLAAPAGALIIDLDEDDDGLQNNREDECGTNRNDIDSDDDNILDPEECPENGAPIDSDGDLQNDGADADSDNDTLRDNDEAGDNLLNTPPIDTDGDNTPDFRDLDSDNDNIPDAVEAGDANANTPPRDNDSDGTPDYLDDNSDNDSFSDLAEGANDLDADGTANFIDADDNDGPAGDLDEDGVKNGDDNCPLDANADQANSDDDDQGDACDVDIDNDGLNDADDNCPNDPNTDQLDTDGDTAGDACDGDDDDDLLFDEFDNCPVDTNADQSDFDADGQGDACDLDDDNDQAPDGEDNCEKLANEDQADNDGDDAGDACDLDDDNDGVSDEEEAFFGSDPNRADDLPTATGGACNVSPNETSEAGLWALLGLLFFFWIARRKQHAALSGAAVVALVAGQASAQENTNEGLSASTFTPSIIGRAGVSTEGAETLSTLDVRASLVADTAIAPVQVSNSSGEKLAGVVSRRDTATLRAAFGVWKGVELRVSAPLANAQADEGFSSLSARALGDVGLGAKARLWRNDVLSVAAIGDVFLPTGDPAQLNGDGALGGAARGAIEYASGNVRAAADLGFRLRPRGEFLRAVQDDQATYGVSASYRFAKNTRATAEIFGALGLRGAQSPAEAMLSAEQRLGPAVVVLGAGAGLSEALGTPSARFFFGLGYDLTRPRDDDQDALYNDQDRCPDQAEDRDGFQDSDGCPDADNDADAIADKRDKCPDQAEDLDKFQDEDGCPDADNDADTIADALDKCPSQAEDLDKFQDEDGCADTDNDADSIADALDKCPNEVETINSFLDQDGCPDTKPTYDFTGQEKIVFYDILFESRKDVLLPASIPILDELVRSLQAQPWIKLRVEGNTDSDGSDKDNLILSQKRALSVVNYLIGEGIDPSRLDYAGYGETRPIAEGTDSASKAKNRRVEFRVIQ